MTHGGILYNAQVSSFRTESAGGELFIFCSERNARFLAFTFDATGANLPKTHGPWRVSDDPVPRAIFLSPDRDRADSIVAAVRDRGFYLSRPDGVAW